MMRAIGLSFIAAFAFATAAAAATDTGPKRPDPASLQFVDGFGESLAGGSAMIMGRLFFHRDHDVIMVEYQPSSRPDPTTTRIVMLCTDTGNRISFPISEQYLGPAPACRSFANLKFKGE